jgi:hypothetical protein
VVVVVRGAWNENERKRGDEADDAMRKRKRDGARETSERDEHWTMRR